MEWADIDEEEIEKRGIRSGQALMRGGDREARDPEWADIDAEEKEKREIWSGHGVFGKRAGLKF